MTHQEAKMEICKIMSHAYYLNYITPKDGNLSIRLENKLFITPTGVDKYKLDPKHILEGTLNLDKTDFDFENPELLTGEYEMHKLLHLDNLDKPQFSIIHLHPTYVVASMYRGVKLDLLQNEFPELSRYSNVGKNVPILNICSKELAQQTFKNMPKYRQGIGSVVGQRRHGATSMNINPWDAMADIERLEHICKIALVSV